MRDQTTVDGHLEYFFAVFKTLQKLQASKTLSQDQRALLDQIGVRLGSVKLLFTPHTLWMAAIFQGLASFINDVSDILGKDTIAPVDEAITIEELQDQAIRVHDTLRNLPTETVASLRTTLGEGIPPITGAPLGGCFIGFDALVSLPLEATDAERNDPNAQYTSAYLLTNKLLTGFRAEVGISPEAIHMRTLYRGDVWANPLSGEAHIVLSLVQILNLARDQAEVRKGLGFKRLVQQLSKQYRVQCLQAPQSYYFPKGVEPPDHAFRVAPKIPGMKSGTVTSTKVVASTKSVVERFLGMREKVETFHRKAETLHRKEKDSIQDREKEYRDTFLQGLRQARIFEIPAELYLSFYHQADKYTTEQIAGFEWESNTDPDKEWSEDRMTSLEFVQCVNEAGTHLELPEKRPFDTFYFGYNPPPVVQPPMYSIYSLLDHEQKGVIHTHVEVIGHLVLSDLVFTCLELRYSNGRHAYSYLVERNKHEWLMPYTLAPWILSALIDWINDHQTVMQDNTRLSSYRRDVRKFTKEFHLQRDAPPPYYTVYMRDLVINKSVRKTFTARFKKIIDWSHRWEVRGHYMVRIKRGTAPLDAKLEKVLRKRKYQIYTEENPPFDVWQKLEARGVSPKKANEWLAVLVSFRKDFVKGPEDKPLVPSVRKSERYVEENNEASVFDDQDIDEQPD